MTAEDLPVLRPWFTDCETRRWLGDTSWPDRLLNLAAADNRHALVGVCHAEVLALVDIEVDLAQAMAWLALVVAPYARRTGVGRSVLHALARDPLLVGVQRLAGGVEAGNEASRCLVVACGFEKLADVPDADGFTDYAVSLESLVTSGNSAS